MRFLFRWQHVQPGTQLHGRDGLLEVIGQLQGLELPARAWETQVLPARIARYDPAELDGLCLAGAVAWGRLETDPPPEEDAGPRRRRLRAVRGGRARLVPAGRWALLRAGCEVGADAEPMRFARQLLRRWGVVVRELLARESRMPSWRVVLGALRALEARGEIRGGRFAAGLVGEQFALPEAVEALRAVRRRAEEPETVVVAAADPLNLIGG